jgi:hypothetical protein
MATPFGDVHNTLGVGGWEILGPARTSEAQDFPARPCAKNGLNIAEIA